MSAEKIRSLDGSRLVDYEVGPGLEAPQTIPSVGRTLSRPTLFDSFSLVCYSPRELADQLESRT